MTKAPHPQPEAKGGAESFYTSRMIHSRDWRQSPPAQLARRIDAVQNLYEARKNRARGPVLRSVINPGGVGAELGVHKGHLTRTLIAQLDPKLIYVVDPWFLLGPTWDWAAGDKSTVNGLRRVMRILRPELESGRASIVIGDDMEWLAGLPDATFDWVYLDTSHQYQHTVDELELLRVKVKAGGIIAGDDWQSDENHRHHGVCRAVRERVAAGQLTLLFADDTNKQWATRV